MKIIMSPSKTKVIAGTAVQSVFNEKLTSTLIDKMNSLSVMEIAKAEKIKPDKAEEVKAFFANYDNELAGCAVESYSGLAFKNLDWQGLSDAGKSYGAEHLVILSGLYGIVEPLSPIKDYRLDLVDSIFKAEKTNLYEFWADAVNTYFANEDWILNIASQEYSKLVQHPCMVSVEFQEYRNEQWKQLSTSSKQMRGRFVHYVLAHQIKTLAELPTELDGFKLMTDIPKSIKKSIVLEYKKQ